MSFPESSSPFYCHIIISASLRSAIFYLPLGINVYIIKFFFFPDEIIKRMGGVEKEEQGKEGVRKGKNGKEIFEAGVRSDRGLG